MSAAAWWGIGLISIPLAVFAVWLAICAIDWLKRGRS